MSGRLAATIGVLAMGAALLVGAAARAQEHVRLVPQLGTRKFRNAELSRNGRLVLTVDEEARLWDAATGRQIRILTGNAHDAHFSPNGRFVVTVDSSNARLWDASTGQQLRVLAVGVNSADFSPDGRFVITVDLKKDAEDESKARLWDAVTGRELRAFGGDNGEILTTVAFSPDGRFVITAGYIDEGDKEHSRLRSIEREWDAATGQQIRILADEVGRSQFSPDGRLVLTIASAGDGIALWDAATGRRLRNLAGRVRSALFSPDGRFVITVDGRARLWDTATGQELRTFGGDGGEVVTAVAFSPDGRFVVSVGSTSDASKARVWDAATGQQIRILASDVSEASFSANGRFVFTIDDSAARLWDATTGEQISIFTGHTNRVRSVAFSQDDRLLTGSDNGATRLWDAATGQPNRSLSGNGHGQVDVVFSPDGRIVLTRTSATFQLRDAMTGQQLGSFVGDDDQEYYAAALSPNGRFVLTANDAGAQLWDALTGQRLRSIVANTTVLSAAFSRDGILALTADRHGVHLWDAVTWRQIRSFGGDDNQVVTSFVAFSTDSRFVITGDDDGAQLWDAATGQRLRRFPVERPHVSLVTEDGLLFVAFKTITSVAFSADGRYLLAGCGVGAVRLWDVTTGEQIRAFAGHTAAVSSVAFSPNGRFVLSGSDDTTTRIWDAATGKQLATLLNFDDGGWAVTDAAGRYDSNDPDNTPGLIWATDSNRVIELKQLKDNYYVPNLLAGIMKGERLPDVTGLDLAPSPPEVAIASAYQPESKRLALTITNGGGGVGRVVVSVNDRKVRVVEHPVAADAAGKKSELTVDMSTATLKPGENTVKVYAFDAGNQIRSHEAVATFTVAAKAKGLTAEADDSMDAGYKPQFYGIVVGTSSFSGNHAMDLLYPAHDAESMVTGLEIGAANLFGKENVHLRLLTTNAKEESGEPTKANIVAAFADVTKQAKPTDVLLVYLSGHGVNLRTEKDSYYYLTTDARSLEIEDNPELRSLSTVSSAELRTWLGAKNMPLKEVLILDTCAAGAANEELLKLVEKRDVPPDQRRAVEFLKDATGTVILMGSAADKVSYEASKYGQGLLTYALLEGMKGRSIEEGSRLNVSHWFQNASEDVTQLAQSIGGVQRPVIAAPSGMGFPVALLDPADQARIPLAAIKPELLHLTCHDDHDHDPLGLAVAVREQLREISHPSVRGQGTDPPVVYHDDMNDGPADSRSRRSHEPET
jgi:WD40 repeat protein